jgi:hypothetical protein
MPDHITKEDLTRIHERLDQLSLKKGCTWPQFIAICLTTFGMFMGAVGYIYSIDKNVAVIDNRVTSMEEHGSPTAANLAYMIAGFSEKLNSIARSQNELKDEVKAANLKLDSHLLDSRKSSKMVESPNDIGN